MEGITHNSKLEENEQIQEESLEKEDVIKGLEKVL